MNDKMTNAYFYLAEDCNLRCRHCWVESSPEQKKRRLVFDECKSFIDAAGKLGLNRVILSGGEPFLNKDVLRFIEYFHEKGIHVTMETNGTMIVEGMKNLFKKCKPYLGLSIDGLTKDVHEYQRGKGSFEPLMRTVNMMEELQLNYQFIMAISKHNFHQIDSLCEYINENLTYCDTLKLNPVTPEGRGKEMEENNLLFSFEEIRSLSDKIKKLNSKYNFDVMIHLNKALLDFEQIMAGFSCGGYCGIKSSISVLSNGIVSVCSLGRFINKDYQFGHVSEIDLESVWMNNPLLLDLRSDEYPGKLKGICGECIFRKKCRGSCRAESINTYSDIFGPHPDCQKLFNSGSFPVQYMIDPGNSDACYYENVTSFN